MSIGSALHIIIVNYRTPELVIDCLRSLEPELTELPNAHVWVVENASPDNSAEVISGAVAKEGWGAWTSLLIALANHGFAAGNNVAIRRIVALDNPPDYVLLLNPDTIVRPGAIASLLTFMQEHPKVGIAGSRMEYPDGTAQTSVFRFPTWISEFENGLRLGMVTKALKRWVVTLPIPTTAGPADWVCGGSMIIRKEVIDSIGMLDDQYFMYYEEVDFCRMAQQAGWPCWYCPESRVVHLIGQSTASKNPAQRPNRPKYWFDSRSRFFTKNYGAMYKFLTDIAWAIGYVAFRTRALVQGKKVEDPAWLWWDFVKYNFGFRK